MTKRTKPSFRAAQHRMAAIAAVLAVAILGIAGTASAQVIGLGGASMTGWTPNNNVGANPGSAGLPSVAGTGTLGDVLTLTNNNNGIASQGTGSLARVSNSTVTDNTLGIGSFAPGPGSILSRGNNTVAGNTSNGSFTGSFLAM